MTVNNDKTFFFFKRFGNYIAPSEAHLYQRVRSAKTLTKSERKLNYSIETKEIKFFIIKC